MKKLFSIVLCLFLALSLMACGGESKKNDDVKTDNAGAEVSHQDIAYIDANGESVYTIIRPSEGQLEEGKCSSAIFKEMKEKLGVAARVFSALSKERINIKMIDQGSSELNIVVGVRNRHFESAIKAIYNEFINESH